MIETEKLAKEYLQEADEIQNCIRLLKQEMMSKTGSKERLELKEKIGKYEAIYFELRTVGRNLQQRAQKNGIKK